MKWDSNRKALGRGLIAQAGMATLLPGDFVSKLPKHADDLLPK